jgi:hypothetical protein
MTLTTQPAPPATTTAATATIRTASMRIIPAIAAVRTMEAGVPRIAAGTMTREEEIKAAERSKSSTSHTYHP